MQIKYIIFSLLAILVIACNLEKNIALDLPAYERELMVEMLLEPGKPYRALVLESASYFDELSDDLPLITDATVIVTYQGIPDTLALGFFTVGEKFYNYGSSTIVPTDFDSEYTLTITDNEGRALTGKTKVMPPIEIDSFRYEPATDTSVFLLTRSKDDPNVANFYRRTYHRTAVLGDSLKLDFAVDDDILDDNGDLVLGGPPVFKPGDTAIVTFYHITEAYYKYLETREESEEANGNPFVVPGVLLSNVEGGIGIFTGFSWTRDTLQLD